MTSPLGPGDRVQNFELPDHEGNMVRLADLLGAGPLVFFFYPKDDTAGCTREACAFRDIHSDLQRAGARVFGISGDQADSHQRFASKNRLNYPLLTDAGDGVRNTVFGVPRAFLGLAPGRVTYVVDAQGVVRHVTNAMLDTQRHVDEALDVVRRLAAAAGPLAPPPSPLPSV